MSVAEAIKRVLEHATPPPPNEAATLFRIIDPLLLAIGYSPLDIEPESAVSQWQRPDRTILPNTEHEWYLEAKAWGVSLDDEKHLQQATNYAHSRGRRWVVLTNGQVWRIYDDHITGLPPAERLVAEARLDQVGDMEQLLQAVSKAAMLSGGLGHFALRSRLSAILTRSLKDEGSEAIRSLWAVVRKQPGMSEVARRDVAAYFRDLQAAIQPEVSLNVTAPVPTPVAPNIAANSPTKRTLDQQGVGYGLPLDHLAQHAAQLATGSKPTQVAYPDGGEVRVSNWRDLTCGILTWLSGTAGLPQLPFRGGHGGHRFFLNIKPEHRSGQMQAGFRKLRVGDADVYVDLHRSAADLLGRLVDVCQSVGVPASGVRVKLTKDGGVRSSAESESGNA